METVKWIFAAVANVFGWSKQRSEVKNAADVKAAKQAQEEVDARSKVEEAIGKRDLEALRKELAE